MISDFRCSAEAIFYDSTVYSQGLPLGTTRKPVWVRFRDEQVLMLTTLEGAPDHERSNFPFQYLVIVGWFV